MTNPLPPDALPHAAPAAPPPARPVPTWIKVALSVSVALNLAVAGLALGAFLKDGPRHRGMPRDMSFGPFSDALLPEDRRALRAALRARLPDPQTDRAAARAEFDALTAALRAAPFDPAALTEALGAIEARFAGRIALGRSLIEDRLLAMTDADRAGFADRLDQGLSRRDRDRDRD
jgi:uncharacterized membrane protein